MHEPETAKNEHLLGVLPNNFVNRQSLKNLNTVSFVDKGPMMKKMDPLSKKWHSDF